jgi:hypothetical protein
MWICIGWVILDICVGAWMITRGASKHPTTGSNGHSRREWQLAPRVQNNYINLDVFCHYEGRVQFWFKFSFSLHLIL